MMSVVIRLQCILITCITLVTPQCQQERDKYICSRIIPMQIPTNVTNVSLYDINFRTTHYHWRPPFNNTAWGHIKSLQILPETAENGTNLLLIRPYECNDYAYTLKPQTFFFLKQLKYLKFKSSCLESMETAVFLGLEQLETLDLNNNIQLTFESAMNGLKGSKLMSLKNLFLRRLATTYTDLTHNNIGTYFHFLKHFPIEFIDLGYLNNGIMSITKLAKHFPHLRKINLEHCGALAFYLIVSASLFHSSPTFQHLREININYPTIPRLYYTSNNKTLVNLLMKAHLNLTSLHTRGVTPKGYSVHMYGLFKNSTSTHKYGRIWNTTEQFCVSVHIQENDLIWQLFSLPINEDGNVSLETLDLAHNNIMNVSPSLFERAGNLRFLDLSKNKLSNMSQADFNSLLLVPTKLTEFYCSDNALKKIPKDIFAKNHMLKIVDFSQNLLETINLKLTHLTFLQILNFSYNQIHFLDSAVIKTFDQIGAQSRTTSIYIPKNYDNESYYLETHHVSQQIKQLSSSSIQLYLEANPFYCACEYVTLIEWIIKQSFIKDFKSLQCLIDRQSDEKYSLDKHTLSSTEYMCKLPKIIAICTTLAIAFIAITVLLVYCAVTKHRRKQHDKKMKETIEKYKSNKTQQFPLFLTYCSTDAEFVQTRVCPELNATLQRMLETEKPCILTGDKFFKPGKWVKEEVIRCIEISRVVVACISENFCKSHFCKDEVLVALTANKPVILMFLEHVHEKKMPKTISKHFNKTARVKWSLSKDGTYVLTPCFDVLCSTILELMNQTTELTTV